MAKPTRRLGRRWIIGGLIVLIATWIVAQYLSFEQTEERYYRQLLLISNVEVVDQRLGGSSDDHDALEQELEGILATRILDISACLRTEEDTIAPAVMDLAVEDGAVVQSHYRSRSATLDDTHATCLDTAMADVGWPSVSIEFVVLLDRRTLVNVMIRQFPWLRRQVRPNPH